MGKLRIVHNQRPGSRRRPAMGGATSQGRSAPAAPPTKGHILTVAFLLFVAVVIVGLGLNWGAITQTWSTPVSFAPVSPRSVTVIDGDTIRIDGELASVRLVGFNSPETRNAACARERDLGLKATERLKGLVAGGDLSFARVECACRPGTEGTSRCNYGRSCGTLRAGGRDVGSILKDEGLAVAFVCGGTSCPPTPRPWCS